MKPRGRRHLSKVRRDLPDRLGAAGAPWGPVGGIAAIGEIASAAKSDDPRQRRRGKAMLLAYCLGPIALAILAILALATRGHP